jgi:hypothetical protein
MTSTPPTSDSLTLFQISQLLLAELRSTNQLLRHSQRQQASAEARLLEIRDLLEGFTAGGASFHAYLIDPLTQAYLAILGPLLAQRLGAEQPELSEVMKGATLLARQLVDELAAYRSQRSSFDYLEEQTELLHDPWTPGDAPDADPDA